MSWFRSCLMLPTADNTGFLELYQERTQDVMNLLRAHACQIIGMTGLHIFAIIASIARTTKIVEKR